MSHTFINTILMGETWKWVPKTNFGYKISNFGRLKTYCSKPIRILKNRILQTKGYEEAHIKIDGKIVYKRVHVIVLETFVGPRPKGYDAAHLNGIRNDNRLINLKWTTKKENQSHRLLHGTDLNGEKNYNCILSTMAVDSVRERIKDGWPIKKIAEYYGVSKYNISDIKLGRSRLVA